MKQQKLSDGMDEILKQWEDWEKSWEKQFYVGRILPWHPKFIGRVIKKPEERANRVL